MNSVPTASPGSSRRPAAVRSPRVASRKSGERVTISAFGAMSPYRRASRQPRNSCASEKGWTSGSPIPFATRRALSRRAGVPLTQSRRIGRVRPTGMTFSNRTACHAAESSQDVRSPTTNHVLRCVDAESYLSQDARAGVRSIKSRASQYCRRSCPGEHPACRAPTASGSTSACGPGTRDGDHL